MSGLLPLGIEAWRVITGELRFEQVLDIREPERFWRGHLPGALNVPYRDVQVRAAALLDASRPVLVVAGAPAPPRWQSSGAGLAASYLGRARGLDGPPGADAPRGADEPTLDRAAPLLRCLGPGALRVQRAGIVLVDPDGELRLSADRTRDALRHAPGPLEPGPCHALLRDRATGHVQYVLATSPGLVAGHPRLAATVYPTQSEALTALAALGLPPVAPPRG